MGEGRFAKQVVLVSGASRGIGAATARAFGAEGAHVVVNYSRSKEAAESVAAEISEQEGASAQLFECDVSDADAATAMVKAITKEHKRLDVLVNNAGITRDGLLAVMTGEEWTQVMDVNVRGAFHLVRAACRPMMSARSGRIINVSSVAAKKPGRGQANYAASKGAIEAFTRAMAAELAPRGITVNSVAPGVVVTEMTDFIRSQASEAILARIPLGRFGTPTDIAAAIVFLASPEASYITGTTLAVDGGM